MSVLKVLNNIPLEPRTDCLQLTSLQPSEPYPHETPLFQYTPIFSIKQLTHN